MTPTAMWAFLLGITTRSGRDGKIWEQGAISATRPRDIISIRGIAPEKHKENTTMLELYLRIKNALSREEGQDLTEYALLVVLIAIAVAAVLPGVANALTTAFGQIATELGV